MANPQELNTINVYFKIPFGEQTTTCVVNNSLTTLEFMDYVNIEVRNKLNINSRYDIEIVEAGKTNDELASRIEPRNDETLLQRYGETKKIMAYYARPVNPITREFVRQVNYSE